MHPAPVADISDRMAAAPSILNLVMNCLRESVGGEIRKILAFA
jgi:hypothetical protein